MATGKWQEVADDGDFREVDETSYTRTDLHEEAVRQRDGLQAAAREAAEWLADTYGCEPDEHPLARLSAAIAECGEPSDEDPDPTATD